MDTAFFKDRYGPTAVVTGASSGIGESFAHLLAQAGLDLVLVARRRDRLAELANELGSANNVAVHICQADLSEPAGIDTIITACAKLDIGLLVSNAGFGLKGPHELNDPGTLTQMLALNCHAPAQLTRALIPALKQRGKGGIIITSSVESLLGFGYSAPYAASKAFATSLAEGLWAELKADGIDVLGLCPSSTDTDTLRLQGIDKSLLEGLMQPEEVAQEALDNIQNGPTHIPGAHNRETFGGLAAMPRDEAITMMTAAMKTAVGR